MARAAPGDGVSSLGGARRPARPERGEPLPPHARAPHRRALAARRRHPRDAPPRRGLARGARLLPARRARRGRCVRAEGDRTAARRRRRDGRAGRRAGPRAPRGPADREGPISPASEWSANPDIDRKCTGLGTASSAAPSPSTTGARRSTPKAPRRHLEERRGLAPSRTGTASSAASSTPRFLAWIGATLRRTFDVDVMSCAACGGRMTLRAVVTDPASIAKLLRALQRPRAPPVAA